MERSCGTGSQGTVVLAKLNNELVCVKIFSNAKVFLQELQMLSAAQNTGFVPLLKGAHSSDKNHFIVMSYHGKITLEDFLYSNPHPKKVHKILISLNDAIQALHSTGIIHNDIKENNILIEGHNPTGRLVTVIDFGWSTNVGESPYPHLSKAQIKDFPWIAPWLAHGGKSSALSDMYSLGYLLLSLSEKYPCPAYNIFGHLLTSLSKYNFNLGLNIYDNELQLKWQYVMSLCLRDIRPMITEAACSKCLIENRYIMQSANKYDSPITNKSSSMNFPPIISFQMPILPASKQPSFLNHLSRNNKLYPKDYKSTLQRKMSKKDFEDRNTKVVGDDVRNTKVQKMICDDIRNGKVIHDEIRNSKGILNDIRNNKGIHDDIRNSKEMHDDITKIQPNLNSNLPFESFICSDLPFCIDELAGLDHRKRSTLENYYSDNNDFTLK